MRCPTCQREFAKDASTALPFCSDRCRTMDLGRWLDEAYGIPAPRDLEEDEAPDPPPPAGDEYEV